MSDIESALRSLVFGQDAAIDAVMPSVLTYQANLWPPRRPAGVFLLLGPTGTGKTHFVESLATAVHCRRTVLRVDCAEYQHDHEIAKLIGAPPGYVGHANPSAAGGTPALLSTTRIHTYRSERSQAAIILFDEIEKASKALFQLLLGILDKGTMRTGANEDVNFEHTFIFMTANLGASEISKALSGSRIGLPSMAAPRSQTDAIAIRAGKKHFSPEFWNRLDAAVVFQPLERSTLGAILDGYVAEYNALVASRRPDCLYTLELTPEAREWLLDHGTSREYGARELRRCLKRNVLDQIVRDIRSGHHVFAGVQDGAIHLYWQAFASASGD